MTLTLNDIDWVMSLDGSVLHHAKLTAAQAEDMEDYASAWNVTLDCGRTAAAIMIPGPFSRMGMKRCDRCCKATGLPAGVGSPKNDAECRLILGLTSG